MTQQERNGSQTVAALCYRGCMEDILRAIVLGVVQGLTEFLPISSSGHLIAVRELFDWQFTDDLTFDVSLHVGTTIAVIVFFWREWMHGRGYDQCGRFASESS